MVTTEVGKEQTEKEFFTVRNVAEILGVSLPTAYRWINEGHLKAIKIGRTVRIPRESIDKLKEEFVSKGAEQEQE